MPAVVVVAVVGQEQLVVERYILGIAGTAGLVVAGCNRRTENNSAPHMIAVGSRPVEKRHTGSDYSFHRTAGTVADRTGGTADIVVGMTERLVGSVLHQVERLELFEDFLD